MFCEYCKDFSDSKSANFCTKCGNKLIVPSFLNETNEGIENEDIVNLLQNKLGYEVVDCDNNFIEAKYKINDENYTNFCLIKHDNYCTIWIFSDFELKKDVTNDVLFYKSLNKLNSVGFHFQYHPPENDDEVNKGIISDHNAELEVDTTEEDVDFGFIRKSIIIPVIEKKINLLDLCQITHGRFSKLLGLIIDFPELGEYFGWICFHHKKS